MSNRAKAISQEQLHQLLSYDIETGEFIRRTSTSSNAKKGMRAGYVCVLGYRVIYINGRQYYEHRLAWLYVHGNLPKGQIDHIDGDRSNNALANLRDVPEWVNHQNLRNPPRSSRLGILGVSVSTSGKRFQARIQVNGKKHHLGIFDTLEEARHAYLVAKRAMHVGCTI